MPELGTAIAEAITRGLGAIKDFQLWLLTGIALSLIAFLIVPVLSAAVSQEYRKLVMLGAGAFTILAACRLGSQVISQITSYRAKSEVRRTFHLTPIPHQSWWGPTRQKDGTIVTNIRAAFMAKNRTDKILHLLSSNQKYPVKSFM